MLNTYVNEGYDCCELVSIYLSIYLVSGKRGKGLKSASTRGPQAGSHHAAAHGDA